LVERLPKPWVLSSWVGKAKETRGYVGLRKGASRIKKKITPTKGLGKIKWKAMSASQVVGSPNY